MIVEFNRPRVVFETLPENTLVKQNIDIPFASLQQTPPPGAGVPGELLEEWGVSVESW